MKKLILICLTFVIFLASGCGLNYEEEIRVGANEITESNPTVTDDNEADIDEVDDIVEEVNWWEPDDEFLESFCSENDANVLSAEVIGCWRLQTISGFANEEAIAVDLIPILIESGHLTDEFINNPIVYYQNCQLGGMNQEPDTFWNLHSGILTTTRGPHTHVFRDFIEFIDGYKILRSHPMPDGSFEVRTFERVECES